MSGSYGASVCGFRHDSGGMGRAINMTSVDSPGGPVKDSARRLLDDLEQWGLKDIGDAERQQCPLKGRCCGVPSQTQVWGLTAPASNLGCP